MNIDWDDDKQFSTSRISPFERYFYNFSFSISWIKYCHCHCHSSAPYSEIELSLSLWLVFILAKWGPFQVYCEVIRTHTYGSVLRVLLPPRYDTATKFYGHGFPNFLGFCANQSTRAQRCAAGSAVITEMKCPHNWKWLQALIWIKVTSTQ